jgi:hypothetical protein
MVKSTFKQNIQKIIRNNINIDMKNNDIKNLSEAYELINEISTDRLRSALRNSKETGFEYDRNRRSSISNKAGLKDLRDPSLPIICVKSYGGDKVCKFKIDKSDHSPLYAKNDYESVTLRVFLISTDGDAYKREIEINRWNGNLYAVGGTNDYTGNIFFADRSDVNKWLQYIKSVVSSLETKEELKNSIKTAEIVMKNLKPSQFDIRMPRGEKTMEQLKFLRNNGVQESPIEEIPEELPQVEEPELSIPEQPQKKSFFSRFRK